MSGRVPRCLAAAAMVMLCALALPAIVAAKTITLGPTLPTGTSTTEGDCQGSDCTLFNDQTTKFSIEAPAAGRITSWSVEEFNGKAELVVLQNNGGGRYSIVAQSAPMSAPCVVSPNNGICIPVANKVYTFPTDLPIDAGQLIGIRELAVPGCLQATPVNCATLGVLPIPSPQNVNTSFGRVLPTPALNKPTRLTNEFPSTGSR